jgi:hypothetical protein
MPLLTEAAVAAAEPVVAVPVAAVPEVAVPVAAVAVAAELVLERERLVAVPVELARLVLERELVALLAADTGMMPDFLTPVRAHGFTRTASAREHFPSQGDISLGLAAIGSGLVTLGLVAPFLVGITHARPIALGLSKGTRRTDAKSRGFRTSSG